MQDTFEVGVEGTERSRVDRLAVAPLRRSVAATLMLFAALQTAALAARVTQVSPQGEVGEVRQVVMRFDAAVVPAGDPRAAAPADITCNGQALAGSARWLNDKAWAYDVAKPLVAGTRCTISLRDGFKPLDGNALQGPREWRFSTGAPTVVGIQPGAGEEISEDQNFLLTLNGAVDIASVQAHAWCEIDGLGERVEVQVVQGDALARLRKDRLAPDVPAVLLACKRAFAPETKVRLVWGPGIAPASQPSSQPQVLSTKTQRWQWKVRSRFQAEFTCERESGPTKAGSNTPRSACVPLRPMTLRFNAPVPRAQALAARLQPEGKGQPIAPREESGSEKAQMLSEVRFPAPLPESTRYTLTLPANLRDDAGRALANAASFPLQVATAGMPPLAKFAGAPFGVLEAGTETANPAANPALMPITLRHVQADLAGARTAGQVRVKRIDASVADAELLRWLARLRDDNDDEYKTREKPMLAREPDAKRAELPQITGKEPAATEVIGIPLPQRGYHVLEIESRILGQALLESKAPMYARTGALVTNLSVHFKRGRSSSLVWVTTLDRGRPVPNAKVAVNDCRGQPLWQGSTDAAGIARIDRGFEIEYGKTCVSRDGLFVTARTAAGDDLAFVFSAWNRGIETWRYNLPAAEGARTDRRAHTVFDRTLLRVGETVSMKHFVREETQRGLALPSAASLPDTVVITHEGSGEETALPLAWPRGARSTESSWAIPRNAALGLYTVTLKRGDKQLSSGSFRVEAFRVPLVDARLTGPSGVLVAPSTLNYAAQLQVMSGGPLAGAPLKLSALLRRKGVMFAGYDEFSFEPPGAVGARDEDGPEEVQKLVADKIAARTDAQGAARITVPSLPALTGPSELLAELSYTDPNGEVQTVAQRLALWPSAVVVGLRVPGWAARRGDAGATVVVLSTDGKPLKDRAVEIVGRVHQTLSSRKRIVGGFYAYDNQRTTRELGTLCSGKTDEQGRMACTMKMEHVGEVELIARAKDDSGKVSEAASSVWMAGDGEWWFAQDNDDRIDVLPEKREVQPGETARLQVRMPFRQATALVSIEREGVIDARVVTLSGREPVVEVPIPKGTSEAASGWAPNVVVSVLVLRGRLREAPWWSIFTWGWRSPSDWWQAFRYEGRDWRAPTAMLDLAKPTYKMGAAQLIVGQAEHKLDVRVQPEKTQYGVREKVRTTVRVSWQGQTMAGAEVAFAAVDEGLLALQPNHSWELLQGLMQPRPWGVETSTAQGQVVGRRHFGRKALPPGGGGGRNATRELFDTLLLWRGSVVLDAKGEATLEVPLNDSLTSFRLVAIADAGPDRFGTGSASVRVTQDLQMLAGLPPLAREGDRLAATYTLRNTTNRAMTVKATLAGKVEGAAVATLDLPPQTLSLPAGAAVQASWDVTVPPGAVRIAWQADALETAGDKPARDSIRTQQVVQPAVPVRVWQASLQPLTNESLSMPMARPADALPNVGGVQVGLQPRLTGALPGLRRYFETYPYSCLEQRTSRSLALHDAKAWAVLQSELPGYLDSDGLAHYFPPSAGSPPGGSDKLTAYVLAASNEAGQTLPDAPRDAMLGGLAAFVEGRLERRGYSARPDLEVRKLAALEALSRYGRVQPRMLGSISWAPAAWPTSALLDAWSLYRRATGLPDRTARLDELQRLVRSRLTAGGTTLSFSTEAQDDWWWLMEGPDANAMRLLLAAIDTPAWKDELPQLMTGALARQRKGSWLTTTANLWGVLALEKFAARLEAQPVTGRSSVQWGGTTRGHDWREKPDGGVQALPWPAADAPLTARHEGSGRPWLTVQTLAAVPLKEALAAGYRITRTVTAIERKRPDAWTRGDTLRVRLEIEAATDMAWVVVSDPMPTGASALGTGLGRDSAIATQGEKRQGMWPLYEERATDAWRGYYDVMPRGRHVVEYTLRLNAAGRFGLPPTRVEAMYAPETFGEIPNAVVEVMP